jgi:aminomethyltransferase
MGSPKETPLKEAHVAAGARLIDFAGWLMPVQYAGIREEHLAVRSKSGVFDISHMGQFFIEGPGACDFLNRLLTNDLSVLAPGQGQYTLMLNEKGGVIDDLIAYRLGEENWFLVVNASMIDADAAWMKSHLPGDSVAFRNESDAWAGLAVQGPEATAAFAAVVAGQLELPPRNGIVRGDVGGDTVIVCRTGYTGEDGFEFFCPAARARRWWDAFLAAGVAPCGLGARDTLRLEMGFPLNGNDLSPERTPLEAGLKIFVKMDKPSFVGREVLARQLEEGIPTRLAAIKVIEKAPPPRPHYPVLHEGTVVGELASGGLAPSLDGAGIGMAYLPAELATPGTRLAIDVRGRPIAIEVVKKPFYKRPS